MLELSLCAGGSGTPGIPERLWERLQDRRRNGCVVGAIWDSHSPGCPPGPALTLCVPTGVRDYIHVVDLAKGHIAALKKLKENCGCKVPTSGCCQPCWGLWGSHWGLKEGLALLPLIPVLYPPPRSTTWAQAPVTLCCRWSGPWRKPRAGR